MESEGKIDLSSAHLQKSYELILAGIEDYGSLEEQRLFIESLICQCALLTRVTSGEEAFHALMLSLNSMSHDELERITMLKKPEVEQDQA
ncbi:hypothetical protein DL347_28755 [Pseudomonas fluorescens]|uniref:Uncharacterized protein n=2 Tax=Pseudomonas fluorescens TaxID=294 RepID=A0A7Z6QPM7_PSEFL|nr:hypothetical protein DL347_28755 [Pseudomonas fluorescens]